MVSFKKIKSFALISVFDKSNLRFLCEVLKKNKIGIISSGSTSNKIRSLDYNCFEISKLTIQTKVSDSLMLQILRQINKLIDVIAVSNEESTYLKGVLINENIL